MTIRQWAFITILGMAAMAGTPAVLAQNDGMERSPSDISTGERALDLYHKGQRALDEGDLSTAARRFRESLSLDRDLMSARRGYARILVVTGRPQRAQDVLAQGLDIIPDDLATARMLARIARDNDDAETAIEALEAIRPPADSNETHLRSHLADLYRRTGQYDEAASVYAQLRRAEPAAAEWILGEAITQDRRGALDSADQAWAALLEHDDLDERVRTYARNRRQALRDGEVPYGD